MFPNKILNIKYLNKFVSAVISELNDSKEVSVAMNNKYFHKMLKTFRQNIFQYSGYPRISNQI